MNGPDIAGWVIIIFCVALVFFVGAQHGRGLMRMERKLGLRPQSPAETPVRKRVGLTHTISMNGSACFVVQAKKDPGKIVLCGWDVRAYRWEEGDYLQLLLAGGRSTRYQIEKLTVEVHSSFYTADCVFAPRGDHP